MSVYTSSMLAVAAFASYLTKKNAKEKKYKFKISCFMLHTNKKRIFLSAVSAVANCFISFEVIQPASQPTTKMTKMSLFLPVSLVENTKKK